jgi:hypothetical protein
LLSALLKIRPLYDVECMNTVKLDCNEL